LTNSQEAVGSRTAWGIGVQTGARAAYSRWRCTAGTKQSDFVVGVQARCREKAELDTGFDIFPLINWILFAFCSQCKLKNGFVFIFYWVKQDK